MIGMNNLGQKGRLGNQLFQYAALVGIAKNRGFDFCIPDHSGATWFDKNVNGNIVTVYHQLQHLFEMNHLNGRFGIIEDGNQIDVHQAEFCKELFDECPDNSSLLGHFESYHYFENAEEEIRQDFVVREHLLEAAEKFHKGKGTDAPVCVSVRRGDYVKFQDHHPPCVESYYRECMEKLGTDRQYVITSDDVEWCKTIFTGDNFVFNDVIPEGVYKPHFDFAVGTLCDDFIIANSTFSWWIAWLGKKKDKQIFIPRPWFGPALAHVDTEGYYCPSMTIVDREIVRV